MASVLPLPGELENSLHGRFIQRTHARSWTSSRDDTSLGTVQRHIIRGPSPASMASAVSLPIVPLTRCHTIEPPTFSSNNFIDTCKPLSSSAPERRCTSLQGTSVTFWHSTKSAKMKFSEWQRDSEPSPPQETGRSPSRRPIPIIKMPDDTNDNAKASENELYGHGRVLSSDHSLGVTEKGGLEGRANKTVPNTQTVSRWWTTLRRRRVHQPTSTKLPDHSDTDDLEAAAEPISPLRTPERRLNRHSGHRKSLSFSSSIGFLTAVKSASITIASTSVAQISRRAFSGGISHDESETNDPRSSFESVALSIGANIDKKARERSIQRRRILEEIISTEEGYVNDMKALYNSFFTLPTRTPNTTSTDRQLIHNAINSIIQLHQELLRELQKTIPRADSISGDEPHNTMTMKGHLKLRSTDSAPTKLTSIGIASLHVRHSTDVGITSIEEKDVLTADPHTVMGVAKVFDKLMRRFLAYEAYAAQREAMDRDATSTSKAIEEWPVFERGMESLQRCTSSIGHRIASENKALTLSDLLSKPIQRICKYPLFFRELCKQTPACDDPVTHDELQKIVFRLEETIDEINKAKDNPSTRRLIETTWRLQDRVNFEGNQELPKSVILRVLGHIQLCGVLYVAHETTDRVTGQYMLCALYRSCLVIATPNKSLSIYTVAAVIPLFNATIDEADNGKGLQCHSAPHTWKIIFEYCSREYEILFSACSEREGSEWRARIQSRIIAEALDFHDQRPSVAPTLAQLSLKLRPLGLALGNYGLSRRESIQRAATVGPKSNLRQVIIRNTAAQRDSRSGKEAEAHMWRSQSHLSSNSLPILAPRRTERSRLENALSDVWSKDILPYPGMAAGRMENAIRASANSVMRKMSMASIASNFSRRSTSLVSNASVVIEDTISTSQKLLGTSQLKLASHPSNRDKRSNPKLVDFHNAPEQFLPEDFDLRKDNECSRRMFFPRAGLTPRSSTPPVFTPTRGENRQSLHQLPVVDNASPSQLLVPLSDTNEHKVANEAIEAKVPTNDSSPSCTHSTAVLRSQIKRPFKSKSRLFTDIKRIFERPFSPQPS